MELDHRFSQIGWGKALATYLELGNRLLGQSKPRVDHTARIGALAELRLCIDPSGWTPGSRKFKGHRIPSKSVPGPSRCSKIATNEDRYGFVKNEAQW